MQLVDRRGRRALAAAVLIAFIVAVPARADWRQFHYSASKRGWNRVETKLKRVNVDRLEIFWSAGTGASLEGINSSPAVVNGTVYVGSDDGKVWAFQSSDGDAKWSFATGGPVRSSPAVAGGVVYVGSSSGDVYALDADDGTEVWSTTTGPTGVTAPPLVVRGRVFVGTRDGEFVALDADTGDLLWSHRIWDVWQSAAFAKGVVYVGSDHSRVYAYEASTGKRKWWTPMDGRVRSAPAVVGSKVFVGTDSAKVYALDRRSGEKIWVRRAVPASANAIVRSSPAVGRSNVYVVTGETTPMDGHVVAIRKVSGRVAWRMHLADYATASPALANGVLYLASWDTRVYAFDSSTGEELWTSGWGTFDKSIQASPVVWNGRLYVGVRDGTMYAFGLP